MTAVPRLAAALLVAGIGGLPGCRERSGNTTGDTAGTTAASAAVTAPASAGTGSASPGATARELRFELASSPSAVLSLDTGPLYYDEVDKTVLAAELLPEAACEPLLARKPEPQIPLMERTRIGKWQALRIEGWAKKDQGKRGVSGYFICTEGGPAKLSLMAMNRETITAAERAKLLDVARTIEVAPAPARLPEGWTVYDDPDNQLRVAFPGAPQSKTDALGGRNLVAPFEGGSLSARCDELQGNPRAQGETWVGLSKGAVKGGKLRREVQLLTPSGFGVELDVDRDEPPLDQRVRLLRRGQRACTFTALVPKGHGQQAEVRAFLDSATVLP